MSSNIRYIVRKDTATKVLNTDPIELESVPCWTVTRVDGGNMGWFIAKYSNETVAMKLAEAMELLVADEID